MADVDRYIRAAHVTTPFFFGETNGSFSYSLLFDKLHSPLYVLYGNRLLVVAKQNPIAV